MHGASKTTRDTKWIWLVALLALVGVAILLVQQARAIARLEVQLQQLSTRIEGPGPAGRNLAPAAQPGGEAAFGAIGPMGAVPVGTRAAVPQGGLHSDDAQAQQQQARLRRALEAEFAAQPAAPRNDAVPQQVVAAIGSDDVIASLDIPTSQDVACRAAACRISARFPANADSSDWVTRLMLQLGTALPAYRTITIPQPDGGYEVRVYAARTG